MAPTGWFDRAHDAGERPLRAAHERVRDGLVRAVGGVVGRVRPGTPVWKREWDVLCILDGCRLDLMREQAARGDHAFLDREAVDDHWSVGSQSAEWMDRTFDAEFREEMARTAYVTGNPFSAQEGDYVGTVSGEVLPLAQDDFGYLYEAWREEWVDGDISTIPPRPLTDAAIAAWRRRDALDIDRVIVHYMQPHAPFRSRPDWFFGDADPEGWGRIGDDEPDDADLAALTDLDQEDREALAAFAEADDDEVRDPWMRVRDGDLPFDEFWEAYRDNLAWVLDEVGGLLENCDARVALTSDHGNGAGEWGVWSHPPGTPLPALRRVPWVDLRGRDRRTRRPDLPAATAAEREGTDDAIEERLADLGYR